MGMNKRAYVLAGFSLLCSWFCLPKTGFSEEYQPILAIGAALPDLGPSGRGLANYLRFYVPRFGENYLLGLQYDRIAVPSMERDESAFYANCLGAQLNRRSLYASAKACHNPGSKIGPSDLNKFHIDALTGGIGSELMLPLWDGRFHFVLGVGGAYGYFLHESRCVDEPCSIKKGRFTVSGFAGIGF